MSVLAWEHHRDALAANVRVLRRRFASNEHAWTGAYVAERLADLVDGLDALFEPTAGELVQAGYDVDEALAIVDRHAAALHKRMGGKP